MPSTVSAVLFDFGGVLTHDPFRSMGEVAGRFGVDPAEFADLVMGRETYAEGSHPWHRLEVGEIEIDDYDRAVDELMRSRGYPGFPGLPVEQIASRTLVLRPEMMDLLHELSASQVQTAIVTNNVKALAAWRDMADWDTIVDAVIDSSDVGMRKPDPGIYLHTCERLDVDPRSAVFLDDMHMNVAGAEAVGMTGVLVDDSDRAISAVRSMLG